MASIISMVSENKFLCNIRIRRLLGASVSSCVSLPRTLLLYSGITRKAIYFETAIFQRILENRF